MRKVENIQVRNKNGELVGKEGGGEKEGQSPQPPSRGPPVLVSPLYTRGDNPPTTTANPPLPTKPIHTQPILTTVPIQDNQSASIGRVEDNIQHVFNPYRDSQGNMPYCMDGDIDMYTPENIENRLKIKTSPEYLSRQSAFIDYLFSSEKIIGDSIDKDGYTRIFVKIASVLYPHEKKEVLAEIVAEDWIRDNGGRPTMDRATLAEALWELVDTWTVGISIPEYTLFLQSLESSLKEREGVEAQIERIKNNEPLIRG